MDQPFQLIDIVPTVLAATGASYPPRRITWTPAPLEGRSMLPAMAGEQMDVVPLYWEHTGNCAIRLGKWKLVREYPHDWELYDLEADRTELNDVAGQQPDIVADLSTRWQQWADRVGVLPWEQIVRIYLNAGMTEDEAAG